MQLHEKQREIARSSARFKVIRSGRRGGKTSFEVESMSFKAVSHPSSSLLQGKDRNVLFIAPTQKQARSIIWEALKTRLIKIGDSKESLLEMKVPTEDGQHTTIYVGGWENRENYRGLPNVYHITFDETDTMKDFFTSWQEIFRPMLIDTGGTADFIGTPKRENPNLRRLEKDFAQMGEDFDAFHFTSYDNPHLLREELLKAQKEMDPLTYKQEILAEYVENEGALFHYGALVDVFSNTIEKDNEKYLVVDVADDGTDRTVFSLWEGLEEYQRERFKRLNTENIIDKIREYQARDKIPMSHTAVDAIGVGAAVASSSRLDGIVGYKSSYAAVRTEKSIVRLPGVHYTKEAPLISEYRNLRSQCVFKLAELVNNHKIASRVEGDAKEAIIEELSHYQDASKGDGKLMATAKEDVKEVIGRSPDDSDTWIMRMYFIIRDGILPQTSEERVRAIEEQEELFARVQRNQQANSTR